MMTSTSASHQTSTEKRPTNYRYMLSKVSLATSYCVCFRCKSSSLQGFLRWRHSVFVPSSSIRHQKDAEETGGGFLSTRPDTPKACQGMMELSLITSRPRHTQDPFVCMHPEISTAWDLRSPVACQSCWQQQRKTSSWRNLCKHM